MKSIPSPNFRFLSYYYNWFSAPTLVRGLSFCRLRKTTTYSSHPIPFCWKPFPHFTDTLCYPCDNMYLTISQIYTFRVYLFIYLWWGGFCWGRFWSSPWRNGRGNRCFIRAFGEAYGWHWSRSWWTFKNKSLNMTALYIPFVIFFCLPLTTVQYVTVNLYWSMHNKWVWMEGR